MQNLDQAIRERAYHLWIADGRRDGQSDTYWLAAQRDILSTSMADRSVTHAAMPAREAIVQADQDAKYPAKKAKAVAAPKKAKRRAA